MSVLDAAKHFLEVIERNHSLGERDEAKDQLVAAIAAEDSTPETPEADPAPEAALAPVEAPAPAADPAPAPAAEAPAADPAPVVELAPAESAPSEEPDAPAAA